MSRQSFRMVFPQTFGLGEDYLMYPTPERDIHPLANNYAKGSTSIHEHRFNLFLELTCTVIITFHLSIFI